MHPVCRSLVDHDGMADGHRGGPGRTGPRSRGRSEARQRRHVAGSCHVPSTQVRLRTNPSGPPARKTTRFAAAPGSRSGQGRPSSLAGLSVTAFSPYQRVQGTTVRRFRKPDVEPLVRAGEVGRAGDDDLARTGRRPTRRSVPGGSPASGLASLTRIRSGRALGPGQDAQGRPVEVVAVGDERREQPVVGGLLPDRVGMAGQRRGDPVAQVGAQPRPRPDGLRERRAVGRGVAQGDRHPRLRPPAR